MYAPLPDGEQDPYDLAVATPGNPPDERWHLPHYATRSVGLGLVLVEATAGAPRGRATPHDLGLWNDEQTKTLAADVISNQGAVPGLQLSHAGRKGLPRRHDHAVRPYR